MAKQVPDPRIGERKAVQRWKAGGDAYGTLDAFANAGSMSLERARRVARAAGFKVWTRPGGAGEWVADAKWYRKCQEWDKKD